MEEGCHYIRGDIILLSDREAMDKVLSGKCTLSEGVVFRAYYEDTEPKQEVFKKAKEKKTMPENEKISVEEAVPQAVEDKTEQAPVPEPKKEVEAITSVPDAPFDVNQIVQSTGGGGAIAIILALVAVVGGGAAWKFYQKFSEQKHEQEMKKLEIQAQQQGMNGAQPPPCQAQNTVLETRMASIETKLSTVEKKSSSLSADFDAEELEGRVLKIEKKVKTLSSKTV